MEDPLGDLNKQQSERMIHTTNDLTRGMYTIYYRMPKKITLLRIENTAKGLTKCKRPFGKYRADSFYERYKASK